MAAPAQVCVEQANPLSHLLMRSFLCLNNPAPRKLLWAARSLPARCCGPSFLLLPLIRLRNCCSYRRCVTVLQFCLAEPGFSSAPQAHGPANTLLACPGAGFFPSSAQRLKLLSDLCHCCLSVCCCSACSGACLPKALHLNCVFDAADAVGWM